MKTILMLWISTLLFGSISWAQSREVHAEAQPARVQGRLEGVTTLRDLANAVPPTNGFSKTSDEKDDDDFAVSQTERLLLQRDAQQQIAVLALPQTATPLAALAGTIAPAQTFLPPNTIDEGKCGSFVVPDGALAASPTYVVEVSNSCLKVLNPSTGGVISGPTTLGTFFGSTGWATRDARALYDPANARFIVSAIDQSKNLILVAVSQSSNPTLGWNKYSFSAAGTCNPGNGDFPTLGQTLQEPGDAKGAIYLAWNIGCPGFGLQAFVGAVSKTLAYSGAAINSINGFQALSAGGVRVDSVQPVNVMNPGDHPRGEFLVNSFDQNSGGGFCAKGCNGVVVWNFYNGIPASGGAQSLTAVVVPTTNTYYLPVNAPEPGCAVNTCGPNAGPPIISGQVSYSAGSIFAALNDSMGILVLELEPFLSDSGVITGARKRNEMCFACGGFSNGGSAYYGTIQPDSERNFVMVYSYSAPGTAGCTPNATNCIYPSAAYISRRVTQTQNTFSDQGIIFNLGSAYYHQLNPQGVNRWGDYSAAAPVYGTPNSFWIEGEYSESNGTWGKAVGQTAFTSPTGP